MSDCIFPNGSPIGLVDHNGLRIVLREYMLTLLRPSGSLVNVPLCWKVHGRSRMRVRGGPDMSHALRIAPAEREPECGSDLSYAGGSSIRRPSCFLCGGWPQHHMPPALAFRYNLRHSPREVIKNIASRIAHAFAQKDIEIVTFDMEKDA